MGDVGHPAPPNELARCFGMAPPNQLRGDQNGGLGHHATDAVLQIESSTCLARSRPKCATPHSCEHGTTYTWPRTFRSWQTPHERSPLLRNPPHAQGEVGPHNAREQQPKPKSAASWMFNTVCHTGRVAGLTSRMLAWARKNVCGRPRRPPNQLSTPLTNASRASPITTARGNPNGSLGERAGLRRSKWRLSRPLLGQRQRGRPLMSALASRDEPDKTRKHIPKTLATFHKTGYYAYTYIYIHIYIYICICIDKLPKEARAEKTGRSWFWKVCDTLRSLHFQDCPTLANVARL